MALTTLKHFAIILIVCLASLVPAFGQQLSAVGKDSFGCASGEALKQLRIMAPLRLAYDTALAGKLEAGECKMLTPGEALVKLEDAQFGSVAAVKIKRTNGEQLFVEARFVQPSI